MIRPRSLVTSRRSATASPRGWRGAVPSGTAPTARAPRAATTPAARAPRGATALTAAALGGALLSLPACSGDDRADPGGTLPREALLDPATCIECHAEQHREWSGSAHAWASRDPVFRAMNARGQRETGGALGDFCVQCHAPMAVRLGYTTDGTDLDAVPEALQGVTCAFCHSVSEVTGAHNAALTLADELVMRGPLRDAHRNPAHRSAYSPLHDRTRPESSALCGACHDVVTPAGVHLERGYLEWQESVFSGAPAEGGLSCNDCHMEGRQGLAADYPGVSLRRVRSHAFPAVDVALGPEPEREAQRALIQRELDATLRVEICVLDLPGGAVLQVLLENAAAGHRWPSGAAFDRRAWVEVRAFAAETEVYRSGVVAEGEAVTANPDPDRWILRDRATRADGAVAHFFWEVAATEADTLPAATTLDPTDPRYFQTHVARRYPRSTSTPSRIAPSPDRVTVRVRLRPFPLDTLDLLVQSGDLAPAVRDAVPTFDLLPRGGAVSLEWTPALAADPLDGFSREIEGVRAACVSTGASLQR